MITTIERKALMRTRIAGIAKLVNTLVLAAAVHVHLLQHAATCTQVLIDMDMRRDSLCRMARPMRKQETGWQRWGTLITSNGTGPRSNAWLICCALESIPYCAAVHACCQYSLVHQSMSVSMSYRKPALH